VTFYTDPTIKRALGVEALLLDATMVGGEEDVRENEDIYGLLVGGVVGGLEDDG